MTTITINLTASEENFLLNDLMSAEDWVQTAVAEKIASCKKRFRQEWVQKLMDDPSVQSIPANDEELLALVLSRPDYKSRAQREAELAAQHQVEQA